MPPARREKRGGGIVWKVALGIVLGVFVLMAACAALIGGAANELDKDANRPAEVRIEAAGNTCWLVTLTAAGDQLSQSQQEGCGNQTFQLGTGLGRNAVVTKRSGGGTVTAALVVDGDEVARESTNAEFGSVTLSP